MPVLDVSSARRCAVGFKHLMQGGAAVARRRVDAEVPHEEGMVILDQGIRRHSNKVKGKRPGDAEHGAS